MISLPLLRSCNVRLQTHSASFLPMQRTVSSAYALPEAIFVAEVAGITIVLRGLTECIYFRS